MPESKKILKKMKKRLDLYGILWLALDVIKRRKNGFY